MFETVKTTNSTTAELGMPCSDPQSVRDILPSEKRTQKMIWTYIGT